LDYFFLTALATTLFGLDAGFFSPPAQTPPKTEFFQCFGRREGQPHPRRNPDLFAGRGIAPDPGGKLPLAKDAQARQADRTFLL